MLMHNGNLFLTVTGPRSLRLDCWHGHVLVKSLFLAADYCPLAVSSYSGKRARHISGVSIFFFFCLFTISWAAPMAYGGSQPRG